MEEERMATPFDVIPAIDLRGGRVVRLQQGDFGRETVYGTDPGAVAASFTEAGARVLHVVDLDGARAGEPSQLRSVGEIATAVGTRAIVEAAGGLRSINDVDAAFDAGAGRVVLGTAALRYPGLIRDVVAARGSDSVVVAVDVRDGRAVGNAWEGATGPRAADVIRALTDVGVGLFEVTAIERDGLLGGPDLELLEELVGLDGAWLIASGGIRDVADLIATRNLGCAGAIVGRALYDGRLDLATAIGTVQVPPT
jgi:phosphoribosylformimino-5-aminoimidazole carboxamide ribotide isomerase